MSSAIKKIYTKSLGIIKDFGIITLLLSNVVALLIIIFNYQSEKKSLIVALWTKVKAFDWLGMEGVISYLLGVVIFLLAIKYKDLIHRLMTNIHSLSYITIIDKLLMGTFIGLMIYRIIVILRIEKLYFNMDYYFILIITFIYISYRLIKVIKFNNQERALQQFIGDTPAEVDLLGRDNIVDSLSQAVEGIDVSGSFVIGLYGDWGEGKTTILDMIEKNIKNTDKRTHVIRFEPWYFKSIDSIIKNYFDLICETLGKKMMTLDLIMLISDYRNLLLDSVKRFKIETVISMVIPDFTSRKNINSVKEKIEKKLKRLDQRVVIFIDDLDRMEREEILLVFKMVKLFSDFDNFIYVLSFDKDRVDKILKNEIETDKDYLDKIIQVGFTLPKVPKEKFGNILKNYINEFIRNREINVQDEDMRKIQFVLSDISNLFHDVRKIKRFNNLLYAKFNMMKNNVNFHDFFIITLIEFSFPIQYKEILNNKNKFIYNLSDIGIKTPSRDLNKERKEYYNNFFDKVKDEKKKEVLKKVMSSIFTSVKNYKDGYDNLYSHSLKSQLIQKKLIEDGQFFDVYFTFEKNEYMLLNDKIEEFVMILNHAGSYSEKNRQFQTLFNALTREEQVRFYKNIKGYMNNIEHESYYVFIKIIYENVSMYTNTSGDFFELSVRKFAASTIEELIKLVTLNEERKSLIEDVVNNCENLEFVDDILYFAEYHAKVEENTEYADVVKECQNIFKNKINRKYIDGGNNVFVENQENCGMGVLMKYSDNKDEVEEYYYRMLKQDVKYIIAFLKVFKIEIKSYVETVEFSVKSFNEYFDKEKINQYVVLYEEEHGSLNDEEEKLINLFKEYYNNETVIVPQ